jgi:hypothetical protein
VRRAVRAVGGGLAVLVAVGGIPGASSRLILHDLVAPPVPSKIHDRGAVVELEVRDGAGAGGPVFGARARALAIVDGRAYLADARDTDVAGRARLGGLPRGEVWIVADAPGHARGSTRVAVDTGTRMVTLALEAEHSIAVAAKDDRGAAVAGAEVEVTSSDAGGLPVGARTGPDGAVKVARLGAGPWVVTARAPGLEEASGHAASDGDTVALVLRKLGGLAVHVVGPDDAPAAGARVQVAGAALWPPRAADTDASGDVHIGGLAAGAYALRAAKEDLVSPIELGVFLDRGEEGSASLRLGAGSWVSVRVLDGDGDAAGPVARASVSLAEAGLSPFPFEATTDAKGRALLGPVPPGPATLSARAEGFVVKRAVTVTAPVVGETRMSLVRAGTLTGRVVDARGFPVDGATIEVVGTDLDGLPIVDDPRRARFQAAQFDAMLPGPALLLPAGELGVMAGPVPAIPHGAPVELLRGAVPPLVPSASRLVEPWVTRADGTFRATPVSPGRVRAIVRHPQYVEAESEVVALPPGGEAEVAVTLSEGGALEGRVFDSHDRPVAGARLIALALRGSLERVTQTASDGTFAFAALPGAVVLTAGDDEEEQVRMEVTVPEKGRQEITVRLPEPRGAVAVAVVDERDFPVDAAQVSASSLSPEAPLRETAFTDAHGGASLKHAAGLPLRLEVMAPGHAPQVVTSDGTASSVRVALVPAETVSGEVVMGPRRDPVRDAEVSLYTDLGVRRVRTDARGVFAISGLAPGAASLGVRAFGFAPFAGPVTVPDSAGRRPFALDRVELSAEAVVEGDVFDGRGNPVAGARVAKDHVPTWLVAGVPTRPGDGFVVTDSRGHFTLGELPEGAVSLEAYSPEAGRGRADGVKVVSGRTTSRVRIDLAASEAVTREPAASGSVAVTLGETGAPVEVQIVAVVEGSAAERGGLAPGDTVVSVDGAAVSSIDDARARMNGPVADDVVLQVRRGGELRALRVAREALRH